MTDLEKIEIPLHKGKLTKGLIASIVFVLLGIWILIYQPNVDEVLFDNPFVKYGAAIAAILFFGFGIFYFLRKLTDKKPGLIIDDNGVIDNSSAVSAGLIPWSDIEQITTTNVMKQKFLIFIVKNPNDYLNRQTNSIKRKGMEWNFKNYGSPITISANGLKYNFDELKVILENKLLQSRTSIKR